MRPSPGPHPVTRQSDHEGKTTEVLKGGSSCDSWTIGDSCRCCISTPPMTTGTTFTVNFPATGNFKFVCLVHNNMTGVVHVLDLSKPLPHTQDFYDDAARDEGIELLTDSDPALAFDPAGRHHVTAGIGEISATAG